MRPNYVCLLALAAGPGTAMASGYSADIELLKPSFGTASPTGLDAPDVAEPGTTRYGVVLQLEEDPLVLYENRAEVGSVVRWRTNAHLGLSHDFSHRLSGRVVVPVAWQWGSQVPDWAAPGAGLGDASAGLRLALHEGDRTGVGLRGDLYLPTGRRDAWLGEERPRLASALLVRVTEGRVDGFLDAGLVSRSWVETPHDFELGPEVTAALGTRARLPGDELDLQAAVLARSGFGNVLVGGAENAAEVVLSAGMHPGRNLRLDVGLGRGLTEGYGTTDLRLLTALTVTRPPKLRPPPLPEDDWSDLEVIEDEPTIVVHKEPEPIEPVAVPLAAVVDTSIVIRDPIRFELGTARILDESMPTLHEVARLLAADPTILHVLIEGHASEEGTYAYNYELSIDRARAIFEALVSAGVHPDRLSYRGMGEVVPATGLAESRRVEFDIVRVLGPAEASPAYGPIPTPWNGEEGG